jgi:hypothetical protein
MLEAYLKMIGRTEKRCYFIWDAIKSALLLEIEEGNIELVLALCRSSTESQTKNRLMINVLKDCRNVWPDVAQSVVESLLPDDQNINSAIIAVELANYAGNFTALEKIAINKNDSVRKLASQYIANYYNQNQYAVWKIMENLRRLITRLYRPNMRALSAAIYITFTLLVNHIGDKSLLEQLRIYWRQILDKYMFVGLDRFSALGAILKWLRYVVVRLISIAAINLVLASVKESRNDINGDDVKEFFRLSKEKKKKLFSIVRLINADYSELVLAEEDFKYIIDQDIFLAVYLMWAILGIHGVKYLHRITSPDTAPIIEFIFSLLDYSLEGNNPTEKRQTRLSNIYLLMALSGVGLSYDADGVDRRFLDRMRIVLDKFYRLYDARSCNRYERGMLLTGFHFYYQLYFIEDNQLDQDFLSKVIRDAIEHRKYDFLRRYIIDASDPSEKRKPWAYLRALRPVIENFDSIRDEDARKDLEDHLVSTLTSLMEFDDQKTTAFLNSLEPNNTFVHKLRLRIGQIEKNQTISNLFLGGFVWFMGDILRKKDNTMILDLLGWWANQAIDARNLSNWASKFIMLFTNWIYYPDNIKVFATPDIDKIVSSGR